MEDRVITGELVKLVQDMAHRFGEERSRLLEARGQRRELFRQGQVERLEEMAHIRQAVWKVDPVPAELLERRVELLGGCSKQEIIEGMNCGAKSYIADLWGLTLGDPASILKAHRNLERLVDGQLHYVDGHGERVRVNPASTTRILFAPRPLLATEPSVRDQGAPVPASFFDLAVFASYNAVKLRVRQGGVYLYLHGVHGHGEARLWKRLFEYLEESLGLPRGTFRATVFLDSLAGALEADEILFELDHYSAGLALDPQQYVVDHILLFSAPDRAVLPDREHIGLNQHILRSLSLMAISVCHKRQAHAIGAPAFTLPPDERGRTRTGWLEMIADKEREAVDGHDGTIVAHPGLVNPAMTEFNKSMPRSHQMYYERPDRSKPSDLVQRPTGTITTEGLVGAIRTVLAALAAREQGSAKVEHGGRSHDRGSIRLSTLLLWSWTRSSHGIVTDTGLEIHDELISYLIKKEAGKMLGRTEAGTRTAAMLIAAILSPTPPNDLLN